MTSSPADDQAPSYRGLRPRMLLLLLAVVAPVFVLALVWAMNRDLAQRRFQFYAVKTTLSLAAARVERLVMEGDDLVLGALAFDGAECVLPADRLGHRPDFDAGFLVAPGAACPALPPDLLGRIRTEMADRGAPGLFGAGPDNKQLYVAERFRPASSGILVLRVAPDALDRAFGLRTTPFLRAVAILGPSGMAVERHRPDVPAGWWPATSIPPTGPDQVFAPSAGAERLDYRLMPIEGVPSFRVAALPARPFLGSDRRRTWVVAAEASVVLLAIVAGTLWAVDRSVLRWVVYLRRIATAHSRGHHSVRASMGNAPTEFASLGLALNRMANDAGRRTALLRETAEEKTALLLELHHRVKNNFQVIISLLSLHRQATPPERREEIRFVEDYVRAMAVAYRVAYDSGDVTGVGLRDLLRSVVDALREVAEAPAARIVLDVDTQDTWVDLDKAISLGLYLAAILPPYLQALRDQPAARLRIVAKPRNAVLHLSIGGLAPTGADRPPLRNRLLAAYVRQLKAVSANRSTPNETVVVMPLDPPPQAHRLAALAFGETEPALAPGDDAGTDDAHERERRLRLLVRDMAHRSKNLMAVAEAIARQSLARATSLDDFSQQFSARLHSLAQSYDLLTRDDWTITRLHDLIRSQLGHYLDGGEITVDGPDVHLGPPVVPYLGLALHELSTNAAKHGALSVPDGRVEVRWGIAADAERGEQLWLHWVETGGPPVVPPTRRGFGTDVTRRLVARALRGTVEFDFAETGMIWRLEAPTASLVGRSSSTTTGALAAG